MVQVEAAKAPLLQKAADKLLNDSKFSSLRREMDAFRAENPWVEDSALFFCLIEYQVQGSASSCHGCSNSLSSLPV